MDKALDQAKENTASGKDGITVEFFGGGKNNIIDE